MENSKNWKKFLITPNFTIRQAMDALENLSGMPIFVVDLQQKLLGSVSDGDIRRGLLRNVSLTESVANIMKSNPWALQGNEESHSILAQMEKRKIFSIPVLSSEGVVVDVFIHPTKSETVILPNTVVVMAGGLGSRLGELTEGCPKPLLKIGSRPILETIVNHFKEYGCRSFIFCLNYKHEKIKNHFGDGSCMGVEISYVIEDQKLGTAGALSLLKSQLDQPFIVTNGDVLTKVKFDSLLNFHLAEGNSATMTVREFDLEVPFGVVKTDEDYRLLEIQEKPNFKFFVNAGIYVFSPTVLNFLNYNEKIDMPDLLLKIKSKNLGVSVFPIQEYWIDVGRLDDFQRAQIEFSQNFQ